MPINLQRPMQPRLAAFLDRAKPWGWAGLFVTAYVMLSLISDLDSHTHRFITPWNPAPALGILFLLRNGKGGAATLWLALIASDLAAHDPPFSVIAILDGGLALGYFFIALILNKNVSKSGMLLDRANLMRWGIVIMVGTLLNRMAFIAGLIFAALLPLADWRDALLRVWIGDGVGIFVTLPLLWWLQDAKRRFAFQSTILNWETTGYITLTMLSLWFAFVPGASAHFRYFYVLFLPLVWAASRQGLAGAIFCASLLHLGMLFAGWLWEAQNISIFELQMRAMLLAIVGFLIGVAVDDQRRAVADLRHTLRLAAAGEMAAALAHELNQPLTALSAYGAACERIMTRDGGSPQLRDVIRRMVNEAGRAAEVVRRLRDFFRTGSTRLERVCLGDLLESTLATFHEKASAIGIALTVATIPDIHISADRLQIEVVLRNLVSNAFDAVSHLSGERKIVVSTERISSDRICVSVEDNGAGLAATVADNAFEPFISTKSSGLGLGLAISRAIAEAHGGSLTIAAIDHGCFKLTLPAESGVKNS